MAYPHTPLSPTAPLSPPHTKIQPYRGFLFLHFQPASLYSHLGTLANGHGLPYKSKGFHRPDSTNWVSAQKAERMAMQSNVAPVSPYHLIPWWLLWNPSPLMSPCFCSFPMHSQCGSHRCRYITCLILSHSPALCRCKACETQEVLN